MSILYIGLPGPKGHPPGLLGGPNPCGYQLRGRRERVSFEEVDL